jgi:hypothetical protein
MAVFNEETLRAEIARVWGEHGAHMEVYDMLCRDLVKTKEYLRTVQQQTDDAIAGAQQFKKQLEFNQGLLEQSIAQTDQVQAMLNDLMQTVEGKGRA